MAQIVPSYNQVFAHEPAAKISDTARNVSLASVSPFKADLKQEFLKPGDVPEDYAQMLQLLDDKNIRAKLDLDLDKQKTMKLVSMLVKGEENEQKIREKFGHNQKELKQ